MYHLKVVGPIGLKASLYGLGPKGRRMARRADGVRDVLRYWLRSNLPRGASGRQRRPERTPPRTGEKGPDKGQGADWGPKRSRKSGTLGTIGAQSGGRADRLRNLQHMTIQTERFKDGPTYFILAAYVHIKQAWCARTLRELDCDK